MAFLGVYRAVYDYAPQSEEELEIKDGDLLFVLEKSTDDDWWKAKKKAASDDDDEPEGLIPNNYVEEAKPIHQARAMYDYTKQTDEEISFKEDTRVDVYDITDPDWTLVGFNGQYGFAPAIYIEKAAATTTATSNERELAPPPMPTRPTEPRDDEPIPGEADYVPPSQSSGANPAAALAGIIAQKTGGAEPAPVSAAPPQRALASPPMPPRPQYTPEESEEEEPAPSLPQRPVSQAPPPQVRPPTVQTDTRATERKQEVAEPFSPGAFRLYNIYEMVSHMGKNKKMPTTLGINIAKGIISITPEQRSDGPSFEWTAEKLTHYSIEGKHIFMELIRPSKSVDFHAGARDTAKEIVSLLGELAGAVRQEGLREVLAASAGTGAAGHKTGHMLYEHMALGDDEVTVAAGDEVIVIDDRSSEDWWKIRRLRNGKEGVVPSSYVEVTGTMDRGPESITGLNAARSTVEQNRLEEERLARESAKKSQKPQSDAIPERGSSLTTEPKKSSSKETRSKDAPKSKPNQARIRTWTDRSGTFKVDAEFIGLRENKIHLHKLNGVKIAVPVSKMAVEDLEYVERATGASLDDDKPLSDIKRRSTLKAKEGEKRNGATIEKKDEYDWFDFFLQCGVNPQICERYAGAFSKDQMGPEILPDVNASLLRTLGLKEGDILRVMKFLDAKYNRNLDTPASASESNGSLFTDASGALRNNTSRKGRPAPPVQTNDIIDESAFKPKSAEPSKADSAPTSAAPSTGKKTGFDDDAWDVKPARSQPAAAAVAAAPAAVPTPPPPEPPKQKVNEDIALLSLSSPPLQPTVAPTPSPAPVVTTQAPAISPQAPQGADQNIFDKIAALAPQQTAGPRQRPVAPQQQLTPGNIPPPPRAASAPGFPPQQGFGVPSPLQPHYTGFQPQTQLAPPGQSLQDLQTLQRLQQAGLIPPMVNLPPQPTGYAGYQQQINGGFQQPNGFAPQQTGMPAMQQSFPALQPQPTAFVPQSQFGVAAYGGALPNSQPTYANGFNSQPTGFGGQATGFTNGFGAQPTQGPAPTLPPQQTGGVFGPSQPIAPLVPQKTGPPPPVRFGVQSGAKPLVPQRTGRAELSRATPENPFGF